MATNTWNKFVFASSSNKTIKYLRAGYYSGASYIDLDTFKVLEGAFTAETIPSYVAHQEQNLPFTFAEGQRGMQGTELKDDGIHHIRRRIEITNENVDTLITLFDDTTYSIPCIKIPKTSLGWKSGWATGVTKINRYSEIIYSQDKRSGAFATSFQQSNLIIFDNRFSDLATAKELLIGLIIEIAQAEEWIEPFNETQQSQYNAIKNARSYDEQTNFSSTSSELGFNMAAESLANANNIISTINSRLDLLEG